MLRVTDDPVRGDRVVRLPFRHAAARASSWWYLDGLTPMPPTAQLGDVRVLLRGRVRSVCALEVEQIPVPT